MQVVLLCTTTFRWYYFFFLFFPLLLLLLFLFPINLHRVRWVWVPLCVLTEIQCRTLTGVMCSSLGNSLPKMMMMMLLLMEAVVVVHTFDWQTSRASVTQFNRTAAKQRRREDAGCSLTCVTQAVEFGLCKLPHKHLLTTVCCRTSFEFSSRYFGTPLVHTVADLMQ